jgi:hypothetical protein
MNNNKKTCISFKIQVFTESMTAYLFIKILEYNLVFHFFKTADKS